MADHATLTSFVNTRRGFVAGGAAIAAMAGLAVAHWFNIGAEVSADGLGVAEAHARATAGEVLLVDIRRPDEWARTGIGEGAHPLDMRREDFTAALLALAGGRDVPIALICARGVRSRHLADRLAEAGFSQVLDVPEGMLGSGAGPGWLRAGLPVKGVESSKS